MPENDKTGTEEENIILHCVQDSQKDESKKSQVFRKPMFECSNGLEASGEEHPFIEWPK